MSTGRFSPVRVENQHGYFVNIDHDVNLWIKQLPSWYWTADNPECGTKIDCTVHADWTQSMLNLTTASEYALSKGFPTLSRRSSSEQVSCVSSEGVLTSIIPDNCTSVFTIGSSRCLKTKKERSNMTITTYDVNPPKKLQKWPTKIVNDPRFHTVHAKVNEKFPTVDKWMVDLFRNKSKMKKLCQIVQGNLETKQARANK